jgi:hypothetical protein
MRDLSQTNLYSWFYEGGTINGSHSEAKGSNISDKNSPIAASECWSEIMYHISFMVRYEFCEWEIIWSSKSIFRWWNFLGPINVSYTLCGDRLFFWCDILMEIWELVVLYTLQFFFYKHLHIKVRNVLLCRTNEWHVSAHI